VRRLGVHAVRRMLLDGRRRLPLESVSSVGPEALIGMWMQWLRSFLLHLRLHTIILLV
jgi:hypothetical protein